MYSNLASDFVLTLCISDLYYFVAGGRFLRMTNHEETGSPGWGASFEDVARAVAAAAAAATARVLKGFAQPSEVKRATYNPEVLTSQKRQWASFQLQYLVC